MFRLIKNGHLKYAVDPLDRHRKRLCFTLLAGLLCLITQGCAGTDELTRAKAAELIGGSEGFSAPISLHLKKETGWSLRLLSDNESDAEAQARAAETYFQAYPHMGALRQLGLMNVRATVRERPGENYGVWAFDVELFLKVEAQASGGRDDQGVLYVHHEQRELVEVTGITKASDQTAQAEYTWKETPALAGHAFVPGSPEHESLPAALRQALRERNQTKRFDKVRRGRGVFQLYDNGWRLLSAQ